MTPQAQAQNVVVESEESGEKFGISEVPGEYVVEINDSLPIDNDNHIGTLRKLQNNTNGNNPLIVKEVSANGIVVISGYGLPQSVSRDSNITQIGNGKLSLPIEFERHLVFRRSL